jgi:hypothetical protein
MEIPHKVFEYIWFNLGTFCAKTEEVIGKRRKV